MPLPAQSIDAISFDYGHVLGGLDLGELLARLSTLTSELGAPAPAGDLQAVRAAMPSAYAAHDVAIAQGGAHAGGWRALVATLVSAGLGSNAEARVVDAIVQALWDAQPTRNLWRDVPASARALLDRLRARGARMVITSNSEGRVAELLDEVGIAHYFVAILDSGRLPFGKPDRRMFELAAEKLSVPIARVVHVGDSEAADVIGAIDAGMRAIRFDGFVPGAIGRPSRADAVANEHEALGALLMEALG